MDYLSTHDFITIRRASLISDIDRRLVTELYQPLIGHQGVAFYLTLDAFHDLTISGEPWPLEALQNQTQLTIHDISLAKASLEAVGLIRSYAISKADYRDIVLELFAPKSPQDFFDDVVLSGMIEQYIGPAMINKMRLHYGAPQALEGYDEQTTTFGEMFHPDFTNPLFFGTNDQRLIGHKAHQPESKFDRQAFLASIKKASNWKSIVFSEPVMKEIERYANLFGVDELAMVELTLTSIDRDGQIDFLKLRDLAALETRFAFSKTRTRTVAKVTSATSKAQKIKLMEQTDPKTYFRYKNNNTAPALADMKIIDDVQTRYNLPFSVINALIDYVLETANSTFPRSLVDKIAASLARARVTSSIDAMEYLLKTTRKKKIIKNDGELKEADVVATLDVDIEALVAAFEEEKNGNK